MICKKAKEAVELLKLVKNTIIADIFLKTIFLMT